MATSFAVERYTDAHEDNLYADKPFAQAVTGFERITQSMIDRYHEQGFLVVRRAFSLGEAAAARDELSAMCTADDAGCLSVHYEHSISKELAKTGVNLASIDTEDTEDVAMLRDGLLAIDGNRRAEYVRKFVGFTRQHPHLKALSHSPELRSALRKLTGEKMKLFVSQALIKPPGGREKPWHQDHAYFDVPIKTPIVGVWIALDTATHENGCMHLWPGGHAIGPRIHFQVRDWQLCDTDISGVPVVSIPLSAGDLLLFDGKIPHGTPTNRSGNQRWAVQYHYIPSSVEKVDSSVRLEAFGSDGKDVYC